MITSIIYSEGNCIHENICPKSMDIKSKLTNIL
jgi:hypothetical protein